MTDSLFAPSRLPAAVLWDMDGTLIDTEPLWGKATFELGELLGRPLTPEVRAKTCLLYTSDAADE